MSRYRSIATERGHYPVQWLWQVLGVPASAYYVWQAKTSTTRPRSKNFKPH